MSSFSQKKRSTSQIFAFFAFLLLFAILPASVMADDGEPPLAALGKISAIDFEVLAALEKSEEIPVVITFNLPPVENNGRYAHHPAAKTDVHPLVFDIVSRAVPGSVSFEPAGSSFVIQARMSAAALHALGDNPDILAVELDPHPLEIDTTAAPGLPEGAPPSKLHCPCTPSVGSTVACLQSNRWRIRANHGGTNSKVAAFSSVSAVFWTFGSTNWEIVGKVINGCSVNNRWWVFAAAASGTSFTLTVEDANFCPNFKTYSSTNPVIDTAAFTCP